MSTHVLFESDAHLVLTGDEITFEAVNAQNVAATAIAAAENSDRIELCGAIAVQDILAVQEAVGQAAEVRANRYAFESLAQIADYARRYGEGEQTHDLFAYPAPESSITEHGRLIVAAVADDDSLASAARLVLDRAQGRAALVELYGGLGARDAALVRAATQDAVPVGFID